MITRRQFLTGTSAIAINQLLLGCRSPINSLQVTVLQDSLPLQLIGDFKKSIRRNNPIKFTPQATLQDIFALLKAWQQPPKSNKSALESLTKVWQRTPNQANLVTLGDYWLKSAIASKLIQPLDVSKLNNWSNLSPLWQNLVKRDQQGNLNPHGQVYGAPYRWGNTVIAYRKDKINWTPTDWSDLWREELRDRISLLDDYREVMGLTLKKLGYSYNTDNLASVSDLETELTKLNQQVKLYSSDTYLQPLVLGDTWLAVGWSTDILPLMTKYSNIGIIIPKSGTSLWADLWVQPTIPMITKQVLSLLENWINFCWEDKAAKQIMLFGQGISPIISQNQKQELFKQMNNQHFISASLNTLQKCEFLAPLSDKTTEEYQSLWRKIRSYT